ncbi:hypothetical protein BGW38_008409 [Lunasporangiospora selenospora]|uniref:Uncharacterized protein n=1 Tax=Lunasporangiospora selenospora TaxID=979761 RepID=A0A9P6G032_9FUNG|nr:hypothetical protein BGW38_008409 [Lunasporangiospora selenospora]
MEDERDAQEVHIPRHHGRMRHSQQSGSFMTNSSRSTSLKSSSRAGSGHNVELGSSVNSNGINIPSAGVGQYGVSGHTGPTSPISTHSAAAHLPAPAPAPAPGLPPPPAHTPNKDDRRDRVGQNVSEDEDDLSSHEGSAKAGHQPF